MTFLYSTKAIARVGVLIVALTSGCSSRDRLASANESNTHEITDSAISKVDSVNPESADGSITEIPLGVRALMNAYPDFVAGYKEGKVVFCDSTLMIYDDGKAKDYKQMLDASDMEDMFAIRYRLPEGEPNYLEDAGRSRCEALFKKMYGKNADEVHKRLKPVKWFGGNVFFTKINGAADSLRSAYAELQKHPELQKYLKSSGTFYWRKVRGATRQSAHSYGIAIDLGVDYSDYWLWNNKGAEETKKINYKNKMPRKLVEIMQRHGFIWGGAWYHYDTMHFEFRPELLQY